MTEKTGFKKIYLYAFGLIAVTFCILKLLDWFYWPKATIRIGGRDVAVTVASTASHWYKGLSGRRSLAENTGMLFKYTRRDYHTMVMRDMRFSLDIVWLDGDRIVDVAPGLKPENGLSEAELTRYRPRLPCTTVIELPDGFVTSNAVKIGDIVSFSD